MNVAVDVSFQDISIAHYTSGRNFCAGSCIGAGKRQHGGSDDFEYVYGGSESDWSNDDPLDQHQAHRQESSLLERICTGNGNIISEFKAEPTLYCIEYVAMRYHQQRHLRVNSFMVAPHAPTSRVQIVHARMTHLLLKDLRKIRNGLDRMAALSQGVATV